MMLMPEISADRIELLAQPRCPVHGQMHEDFAFFWWVCHGYDGEGCDYVVTDEERYGSAH
jgi:hypothetical protein